MTVDRLLTQTIVVAQIEMYKRKYATPSISAIDTTKPSVQSSPTSDPTANATIQKMDIDPCIKAEFKRLIDEKQELDEFIYGIEDELVKAVAIRKFVEDETYAEMSKALHYSPKYLKNILNRYLKKTCDLL